MNVIVLLLWLHLLAAAFWVGGMATMHFAVRPAALKTLPPPLRLSMMAAALERFLAGVGAAIALLLVTGLALIGLASGPVPWNVAVMGGVALVMIAIFGHIRFASFRRLQQAAAANQWPQAGAALNHIRIGVVVNLVLGVVVFGAAVVGR
jgi:uncharacterized membrane protein